MENASPVVEALAHRSEIDERIARARIPKIPTTARRHLLAQGLRRFADRVDN